MDLCRLYLLVDSIGHPGKSLLLNLLFYKDCFDVSPTIKPCTKGINMISSPFHIKGKNIWVFDTEGFGSM